MQDPGIGDEQIIADQLNLLAQSLGEVRPALPITFVHPIFDGDNRIRVAQARQVFSKLNRRERLAFAGQ
ncbi:hypothetical protein D3C79_830330 [compost metagenome]